MHRCYVRLTCVAIMEQGRFAMAFHYDEQARTFEMMMPLAADDASITVATNHFSSIYDGKCPDDFHLYTDPVVIENASTAGSAEMEPGDF